MPDWLKSHPYDPNICAQVEPDYHHQFRTPAPTELRHIMSSVVRRSSTSRRSRRRPPGGPEAHPPPPRHGGSPDTEQRIKISLLSMPIEIITIILLKWTMMEWFAPAIARQICRDLKEITDSNPHMWSKMCIPHHSSATVDGVAKWLQRAKSVPKEMTLAIDDVDIVSAALEGAKDATSLIYQIPIFQEVLQEEVIRLPIQMPHLRHLHLDTSHIFDSLSLGSIFGHYNPPDSARFPCLTVMNLFFIDLINFDITPGLFPAIRRLVVHSVCGPILDLIRVCSGTLEHLRVTLYVPYDGQSHPDGCIHLPNLKVLIVVDALGIVSNIEAPTLRLIYADLAEINGSTRTFSSVVEWVTRQYCPTSRFQDMHMDITEHLQNMPNLQHLIIFQSTVTLKRCFTSLRDNPRICPHLHFIEVVDFADTSPPFLLDGDSGDYIKACVAWRAESVPEFTLQFVDNQVHLTRLPEYYAANGSHYSFEGSMRTFEIDPPESWRGILPASS